MALPSNTADTGTWVGGQVNALVKSGTDLFVAGGGPYSPNTGHSAVFNKTNGQLFSANPETFARANNNVIAVASDGSGGWFLGGQFTEVMGETRNYLAHIKSDGTLDEWNPDPSFVVTAMAVADGILYVGGQFTTIASQTRNNVAAFDLATLSLTSFAPNVASGQVNVIIPDAAGVYLGGSFTTVNSAARKGAVLVTGADGTTNSSWNPNLYLTSGTINVSAILVTSDAVYIGGNFEKVGGSGGAARKAIAAVDKTTGGVISGFDAGVTGSKVRSIVAGDSTIYVGGLFTVIGGQNRRGLAELSTAGVATALDPSPYNAPFAGITEVSAMVVDSGILYYGGVFTQVGGASGPTAYYADSVMLSTGARGDWRPTLYSSLQCMAVDADSIMLGGSFDSAGGYNTSALSKFDAATGQGINWVTPAITNNIWALCVTDDTIYIGGDFSSVGGESRSRIAALDRTTGELLPWYPTGGANNRVISIKMTDDGNYLFVAGSFTSIGGVSKRIAKISVADGTVQEWDSGYSGSGNVNDLLISDDYLYFANGNTQRAPRHIDTGVALDGFTAIDVDNTINSIAIAGDTLFIAGYFGEAYPAPDFNSLSRPHLIALNKSTGEVLSWDANVGDAEAIHKIVTDAENVYIAAEVDPEVGFPAASAYDLTTAARTWQATIGSSSMVYLYAIEVGSVYLGGDFETVDGENQTGFAMYTADFSGGDDEGGGDGGDESILDLALARYQVDFVDSQQLLMLTDAAGITRLYNHGDIFQGPEYFDQYTVGEDAILVKLTDSLESGEFVDANIPADGLTVLVHGKQWNLLNTSEVMISVETYNVTFRVGPGESLLFPLSVDATLSHESGSVVSVKMFML